MEQVQLIGVSLTQLQNRLSEGVLNDLKETLHKHFTPKTPTIYLTRKEVAKMLHVDLSTIHNWTKAKKLKAYSIGNRVYFKRKEVEQSIIHING